MEEKLKTKEDNLFIKLDETSKNDKKIEFRYSREKRLEKAPPNVTLLYKEDYIKKGSLFSGLINSKGNKAIFISLCILVILNLGLYFYFYNSNTGKIDGVKVELESFIYNGELLINVNFFENKNFTKKEEVKAILKVFNKNGKELYTSESSSIYIGSHLMLHFKTKNNNIKNIQVSVLMDGKVITLSKKI